ncbi:DUF4268 domain-containing protein [Pedobacter endophyticus]|uniref:DUF4268 domain-containing protein n=1 Tax=Pedobacter endophyticus TaxID=2789740 RepID=A0A7S9L224_9SPHI|nr:DUF4268 domain-containing protein [Pedobacter endophyticus]QPH41079.1 DUF4268 domain-containing protein [Pedobacter endophyticus]
MYSREEAAKLKQQFWITFGQYMKPVPSASGSTVHWVNYRTGVKNIFFKMDVTNKKAVIAIQLTHNDDGIRHLIFEQFEVFKSMLSDTLNEEWDWFKDVTDDYGKTISQISMEHANVSVFNQQHWPDLISFFKPRIIALDEFWDNVKPVFESLV